MLGEGRYSKGFWDSARDEEATLDCFVCFILKLVICIFDGIQVAPDEGRI